MEKDIFTLMSRLPSFITIRLAGTDRVWTNCIPRLTMYGSTITLSYGIGDMDYVFYERIEDVTELDVYTRVVGAQLRGKDVVEVEQVFVNGKKSDCRTEVVRSFSYEDVYQIAIDVMNFGMCLRQDQLNGVSGKSGKEVVDIYICKA